MAAPDDLREAGLHVAGEMLGADMAAALKASSASRAFGAFRGDMALRNVFGELWARPGLDRRARSLLTLGILIALRQTEELKIHVVAAVRNGCTVQEVEEALYHACAYAGFPAATQATRAAAEALREAGLLDEA